MLRQVLQMVEAANGSISLGELSRQLGVDAAALDGMLDYWVRKGRLQLNTQTGMACSTAGAAAGGLGMCGSCGSVAGCPFIAQMPRSYSLIAPEERA